MRSRFEHFSFGISAIYRYIQKIERDEMIQYGFRGAYAQYLAAMNRYPDGLTATQLGDICDKDKAAVSRIVADMEDKGLVRRENTRTNAYRARLKLTEEGKKAADYVCRRAQAAVDAAGQDLSEEERHIFYASLDRIASRLQTISREGIPPRTNIQNKEGESV
ncbi:MAG: winged helix-turn-helix transcriptional regulator [Clostridia bacterium]|nr:winged helix-turn-helix transcriptional regulator [Clostridia bacterium]